MRLSGPFLALAAVTALVFAVVPSCSLGDGSGAISGTLNVPNCWSGRFEFTPDFFAGVPYRDSLVIRIQQGGDYQTFSDGVSILVDNVHLIRPDNGGPGLLGVPLSMTLPPGVVPPGVPIVAQANPALVHMSLYLQRTCRTQDVALYALDEVTLNADGTCDAVDGADFPISCAQPVGGGTAGDAGDGGDAGSTGAPSLPTGKSTITFTHLFNANPDEEVAAERLSEGTFDAYLADPRDICPGGLGPPARCRGHLTGSFKFYFERGKPAQPFP